MGSRSESTGDLYLADFLGALRMLRQKLCAPFREKVNGLADADIAGGAVKTLWGIT